MTLLALVSRALEAHGVAHAVIGAAALAVHGVSRSTVDIDLRVTDPRCFDSAVWAPVEAAGAAVDMRRGDADDPLAGVIRISRGEDPPRVGSRRTAPHSRGPDRLLRLAGA